MAEHLDSGRQRAKCARIGHAFDPNLTIAPIPQSRLANEYVSYLLQKLHGLEASAPAFAIAAKEIATARADGGQGLVYIDAHMVSREIDGPDDPLHLTTVADPPKLQKGDALLGLGYMGVPEPVEAAAEAAGVRTTWFVAPTPAGSPVVGPLSRWIDAGWRPGDFAVRLPGYDVGALPPSGILQLTAYGAVAAASHA